MSCDWLRIFPYFFFSFFQWYVYGVCLTVRDVPLVPPRHPEARQTHCTCLLTYFLPFLLQGEMHQACSFFLLIKFPLNQDCEKCVAVLWHNRTVSFSQRSRAWRGGEKKDGRWETGESHHSWIPRSFSLFACLVSWQFIAEAAPRNFLLTVHLFYFILIFFLGKVNREQRIQLSHIKNQLICGNIIWDL